MFGISLINIKIIAFLVLAGVFVSGFYYIKYLNSELENAALERQRIVSAFEEQKKTIENLNRDIERISSIQQTMFENLNRAQVGVREQERRLSRQFSNVQSRNVAEIERLANEVSRETVRCNEIATGSPLTEQERNGQVTNASCPELLGNRSR